MTNHFTSMSNMQNLLVVLS